MFIYLFRNPLFATETRKMVLSFPIPQHWIEEMRGEGWELVLN